MGARGSHNKARIYFHNNDRVEMFPNSKVLRRLNVFFFLIKAPVQKVRKKINNRLRVKVGSYKSFDASKIVGLTISYFYTIVLYGGK